MTHRTDGWSQQPAWRRTLRAAGLRALRVLTRLEVEGVAQVPAEGPCVFAISHRSILDGALACLLVPRPCAALVAEEWQRRAWVRASLAGFTATIPLARDGRGWQGLLAALRVLEQDHPVAMCPEGGVSRLGLRHGHPGVVWLAAAGDAPVVPMVIHGDERMAPLWRRPRRPLLRVRFGAPIACARDGSREAQVDVVMRAMAAMLPAAHRGQYGRLPVEEAAR